MNIWLKVPTIGKSTIEDEVVVKFMKSKWSNWHLITDDKIFEDMSIISKSKITSLVTSYNGSNYILCLYTDSLLLVLSCPNVYNAYSAKNIRS